MSPTVERSHGVFARGTSQNVMSCVESLGEATLQENERCWPMLTPQRSFFVENTVPRWQEILSRYLLQAITAIRLGRRGGGGPGGRRPGEWTGGEDWGLSPPAPPPRHWWRRSLWRPVAVVWGADWRRADDGPATAYRWAEVGGQHHHNRPPPPRSLNGAAFDRLITQPPQDPPPSFQRSSSRRRRRRWRCEWVGGAPSG